MQEMPRLKPGEGYVGMKVVYMKSGEYGFETGDVLTLVEDDGSTGSLAYMFQKAGSSDSWYLDCDDVRPATDAEAGYSSVAEMEKVGLDPSTAAPPSAPPIPSRTPPSLP